MDVNGMKNGWMEGKKDRWVMDRRPDEDTDKQTDTRRGQNAHVVLPGKTEAHTPFPSGSQNPQAPQPPSARSSHRLHPPAWSTQEVTAEEHGRWGTGPRLY